MRYDYARTAIAEWRERDMPIPTGDVTREGRGVAIQPAVAVPA